MSGIIYYLSFFPEGGGFLFPEELPDNFYSPGLFLLLSEQGGNYSYQYKFDAMDNGERVSLSLIRANEENQQSTLYVVKTKNYGSFGFDLKNINPQVRYIGERSELSSHSSFSIALSIDSDKLERVCKEFNFYFIGSTLREENL